MLEHPCLSAQHEHFSRPALSGCLSVLRAKQGLTLICGLSPRRTCDCHWCPCYPNSWTSSVVSICRHTAAATIQQCWRAAPLALARRPIPLPGCLTVTSLCGGRGACCGCRGEQACVHVTSEAQGVQSGERDRGKQLARHAPLLCRGWPLRCHWARSLSPVALACASRLSRAGCWMCFCICVCVCA